MERNLNKFVYKPFQTTTGFYVQKDKQQNVVMLDFLDEETQNHYQLNIDGRSMVPRDGLLIVDFLKTLVKNKRVLDLGTGGGLLAIHSMVFGASRVLGVDIDNLALESARDNALANQLNNIEWRNSNLFSEIYAEKFDLILSNPPQLPMKSGLIQDTGGSDGRHLVRRIISESPNYLVRNGVVLMVLFDFLGVDMSYNNNPPLKELFIESGFEIDIIAREKSAVRKGGQTEKSTEHILNQYPGYKFEIINGEIVHEKLLVKAQLVKN